MAKDKIAVGQFWEDGGEIYILSHVEMNCVTFISLENGNRFTEFPIKVKSTTDISEEEFKRLNGRTGNFTRITKDYIIEITDL